VVTGIVYGPLAARHGGAATVKLLKKAGMIYVWATVLTLTAPIVAHWLNLGWDDPLKSRTVPEFVVSVVTLHLTYHLTDVLLLYVLLFGFAGLIIVSMVDGHTTAVLITSWAVWGLWQTASDYPAPWDIQAMNVFQFAAWQALFVSGIALGLHRQALARRFPSGWPRAALLAGGLGLAGAILSFHLRAINRTLGATAATHLVSKSDLAIGRLVVFVFLAAFAFGLATLAWQPLRAALGWLLIPVGQHSLTAYILHIGVVMAVAKLGLFIFGQSAHTSNQNVLLQLAGVLLVWGLIHALSALRVRRTGLLPARARYATVHQT
ncbi:MAG TPA: OpgC domain-containing protein, partial [Chloroflexota bacterium]|nr:OpgC domain-containing protein [Chloroflexota bacterium]